MSEELVIWERVGSRNTTIGAERQSVELQFMLTGTEDDLAVRDFLNDADEIPDTYGDASFESYNIRHLGSGIWEVTAVYNTTALVTTTQAQFSFETGGGTQHILFSKRTVASYPLEVAPDFKQAIGATDDAIEGCDVVAPQFHFAETHFRTDVSDTYKRTLARLTACVNSAPFRGFEAGEVLFLGASGSRRGTDNWEVGYRFAVQLNVAAPEDTSPPGPGIVIGDLPAFGKKGWHYLWVRFDESVDTTAKMLVKRPRFAFIEQVYDEVDFAALELDVEP